MSQPISKEIFLNAFRLMATAKTMAEKYEANKEITSKGRCYNFRKRY